MTDKEVSHFLGLDIDYHQESGDLFISQSHSIDELLADSGLTDRNVSRTPCAPDTYLFSPSGDPFENVNVYQMFLGRLIYLCTHSRLDITYVVSRLCAFMHASTVQHFSILKRMLRYLKFTKFYRLKYSNDENNVSIYCDVDFANDTISSRSITGVAAFVYNNIVDWYSRKQRRVATSTCRSAHNHRRCN